MPIAAIAAIGAIGSVAGGIIGGNAAGKAADTQANAALQAAQLQSQSAQKALDFQKYVYGNNLQLSAPYVQTGWGSIANLANLMGVLPKDATYNPGALTGQPPNVSAPNINPQGSMGQNPADKIVDAQGNKIAPVLDIGGNAGPGSVPNNTAAGTTAPSGAINLSTLINPDLGATGSLAKGFDEKFAAPTNITEQNDPGFQARLKLGQDALERSAAAKGNLLTGGFAKDLNSYAQDYASNEYGNVYNRAFNEYAQRYNMFNTSQTNLYNRLANLAGMGQTSTNQLGLLGQNAAGNIGSILLNSGSQIGGDLQNAAAARASGYVGSANAYGGAISGLGSSLSNYLLFQKFLGGGSGSGSQSGIYNPSAPGYYDPVTGTYPNG